MKNKVILIVMLVAMLSTIGFSHQSVTKNNLTIEINTEPNEPPIAGNTAIISFDVTKTDGEHPNHVDIYYNITKDETLVTKDYYIHSHLGVPSSSQYFESAGLYKMTLHMRPSDHYEDSYKFEPFTIEFNITVNPDTSEPKSYSTLIYVIIFVALIVVALVLFFKFKK